MRSRMVMEQVIRCNNVTRSTFRSESTYNDMSLNCMNNRVVIEQVTRYNNVT